MSLLQVETATAVVIAGAMSIALELAVGRLRPAVARGSASVALGFSLLLLGAVLAVTRPGSALLSFWPLDDPAVRVFLRETVGFVGGTVLVVSGLVWRLAAASSADSIVETRRRLDEKTRELTSAQGVINCIVRSSVSGVMILDAVRSERGIVEDFQCRFLNEEAEQFLARKAGEILDKPLLPVLPRLKDEGVFDAAVTVIETGVPFRDERSWPRDDDEMWYQIALVKHGDGIIATFTDVSARRRSEKRLQHVSRHDPLTDLPSRTQILDRLTQAITRGKRFPDYRFAVLLLDIDRFQIVNDSLGHEVGDRLLVSTAERLRATVRDIHTSTHAGAGHVPGRLGGDEFVILLDGIPDARAAMVVAERLQSALAEPHDFDGHEVISSSSIGIVTSDAGYEEPEHILRDADTAMNQAKQGGKARAVIFDRKMHEQVLDRLKLEKELRQAAAELKDFRLHYQPILRLTDGTIKGFEALIRWHHPQRGLVPPSRFVDLAEELGLIIPIGNWVTKTAADQLRQWQARRTVEPPLTMTVNLTKTQLNDPKLIPVVKATIKAMGIDPQWLVMEITESTIMNNFEGLAPVLDGLHDIGVRLAMDDFGTGHSSLSFLHDVPMDILKIDRSFIMRTGKAGRHDAIVRTIVRLAHELNMEVVGEGIETPEQMALLQGLECNYGQGYLFAQPLDAGAAEAFVADGFRFSTAA